MPSIYTIVYLSLYMHYTGSVVEYGLEAAGHAPSHDDGLSGDVTSII